MCVALPHLILKVDTSGDTKVSIFENAQNTQAGKLDSILSNMPAFPDNVHLLKDGTFWVGYVGAVPPIATMSWIFQNKMFRTLVTYLPSWLRPAAIKLGGGVQFDGNGYILKTVLDYRGRVVTGTASGLLLSDDSLLMGSLTTSYISITDLKAAQVNA